MWRNSRPQTGHWKTYTGPRVRREARVEGRARPVQLVENRGPDEVGRTGSGPEAVSSTVYRGVNGSLVARVPDISLTLNALMVGASALPRVKEQVASLGTPE